MSAISPSLETMPETPMSSSGAAAAAAAAATPMGLVRVLSPAQRAADPGKTVVDLVMFATKPEYNKRASDMLAKIMSEATERWLLKHKQNKIDG